MNIRDALKTETATTLRCEAEAQEHFVRDWQCSYCDTWNMASISDCAGCGRDSQEPFDDHRED